MASPAIPPRTNDQRAVPMTRKARNSALPPPLMTWSMTTRISAAETGLATE